MQTAAFDAASNSGYQAASAGYSWSHTCTGNARVLVVSVELFSVAQTVTGITYNGVALTLLGAQTTVSSVGRMEMWGLIAPATGAHSIAVTLSGSIASCGTAVSLTGINQTGLGDTETVGTFASAQDTNVGAADADELVSTDFDNSMIVAAVATDDTSVSGSSTTIRANVTGALGSGVIGTQPVPGVDDADVIFSGIAVLKSWAIGGVAFYPAPSTAPVITDPVDNPHAFSIAAGTANPIFTGAYTTGNSDLVGGSSTGPGGDSFEVHVDEPAPGQFTVNWTAGGNIPAGSYDMTATIEEEAGSDSVRFLITVESSGTAPTITSNGGGSTANISVAENTTAVTTVVATGDATIVYSKGGTDAGKFTIDSSTGVLTFTTAPNYEVPTDANADNVYLVTVTATNSTSPADSQDLSVTVTNATEATTGPGGGSYPGSASAGESPLLYNPAIYEG